MILVDANLLRYAFNPRAASGNRQPTKTTTFDQDIFTRQKYFFKSIPEYNCATWSP